MRMILIAALLSVVACGEMTTSKELETGSLLCVGVCTHKTMEKTVEVGAKR